MKMTENIKVTGVTYQNRQKTLMGIRTNIKNGVKTDVVLVREPKNQFDKNAIKVIVRWRKGEELKRAQVGYIPRETAEKVAPLMDKKTFVKIKDYELTDTKTVGLHMTLEWNQ